MSKNLFRKLALILFAVAALLPLPAFAQNIGGAFPGNPTAPFIGIPRRTGFIYFVDGSLGQDSFTGTNPSQAFKTIGKALTSAQNGRGDVVFVYPGTYAENLTISQDYLSIIGATGNASGRPNISPTAGTALTVTGNGVKVYGFVFTQPAVASDTVVLRGNGFIFEWDTVAGSASQGATNALVRLQGVAATATKTASFGFILNSRLSGNTSGAGLIFDDAATTNLAGESYDSVTGNVFVGNTLDIATADSGSGIFSIHTSIITGNTFEDKNKATYIDLTTANGGAASDQTGAINGNTFASDTITTTKIKMVGTAFTFSGNVDTVGVVDGSGLD